MRDYVLLLRSFIFRSSVFFIFFITFIFSFAPTSKAQFPFIQRQVWDGPFDIKMIGAPNLDPVFVNPAGASSGNLLADSLITDDMMQRTGSLLDINNRYKGGSPFVQLSGKIPKSIFLCPGDPNVGGCLNGLTTSSPNSTCPVVKYNGPDYTSSYVSMSYADYDNDLTTFSSSMAQLDISSCAEIEAAFLYWTGMFKTSSEPTITLQDGPLNSYSGSGNVFNTTSSSGSNSVLFKIPGGSYQTVTATAANTRNDNTNNRYLCVSDVTSIVQGTGGGQFWVGNLQSYPVDNNGGSTSGWALVVIFRSPLSPPRLISLWDGLVGISSGSSQTFTLTGLTAPSTSNFKSYIGFGALDGENLATELSQSDTREGLGFQTNAGGSYVEVNPFLADQPHYMLYNKKGYPAMCDGSDDIDGCKMPLYDANWCSVYDGISSSHITTYNEVTNTNGNEITRLPSNKNTLGIDLHHMKLPDGSVAPGATQATLTVKAGAQGGTDPFLAYVAIERLQPKLVMDKTVDKNSSSLSSQITYTVRVKNLGNYPSLGGDIIYDTLDVATTYTSGSFTSKSYVNGVVTSPAAGVSFAQGGSNDLKFTLANPIQPDDSVDITFTVDIISYASNPGLFSPPNCKRTIENTAWADYNTISSGVLRSKSNANDCGIGSETKVLLVDAALTGSSTTKLGPYQACSLATDSILTQVKLKLVADGGISSSDLSQFDIRDSNYVRIKTADLFGNLTDTVKYLAIRDVSSGGNCQEVYEVFFYCNPCTKPVITSAAKDTVCSGTALSYTITSSTGGTTTYTWSRAMVTGINNTAVTNQNLNPITETLINTGATNVTVRYKIVPGNVCTGDTFNYDVTVRPVPVVISAATGSVCSGVAQNYDIKSNVSTATFSWDRAVVANISNAAATGQTIDPITETLTNTGTTSAVVRYVITPVAAGCTGSSFNYDVTVNPLPSVTSATTGTVCSGTAQSYNITSNVTGATFSWDRAAVTNISNTAVTGKTNNPITETLTNTSTGSAMVTYVITPSAGGCTGSPVNYTVTVNPKPSINSVNTGSVCSGVAQNYDITSNISTATFTWDRATVANISNGATSAQTADPITETLTNTGTSPVIVTYLITPSSGGCTGSAFSYKVVVNPTPSVNSAATGTICSGTAQSYDITSNVTGAAFSWDRAAVINISNAAVTGQVSDPITETLNNTSNVPVVVTYVITPSSAGCTGSVFNYNVTVNPVPSVTSTASNSGICSGTAQNYDISSDISSATFIWDRVAVANISNTATTGQTSDPITETLINTGSSPVTVTYAITPVAGACTGNIFNYNVTVNPAPIVTSAATGTICSGSSQSYDITSNISTATFSWDRAAVTNISNAAVTAQTGDPIVETLTNTGNSPVSVRYVLTPTASSGCPGIPFNYDVIVNPVPSVTSAASNSGICSGTVQNYDITSDVSSATFTWNRNAVSSISNPAVTGQTSDPITETLINTSTSPVTVTYVITPAFATCTGSAMNYDVTVNPSTVATVTPSSLDLCAGDPLNLSVTATGLAPAYQWELNGTPIPGATSSTFSVSSVSSADAGQYAVALTNACPAVSDDVTVTVTNPPSDLLAVMGSQLCQGGNATVIISNSENGITYEAFLGAASVSAVGNGNGGDLTLNINSSALAVGSNVITIKAYGCHNVDLINTASVDVTAVPSANAGSDIQIGDFTLVTLDGSGSSQGSAYGYLWTSSDPASMITAPDSSVTMVQPDKISTVYTLLVYNVANPSCNTSDAVDVTVIPQPVKIPNAFSPNGDGIHDFFEIQNIKFFQESILYVYNQWGELIYKSDPGYTVPWDGKRNGKDVPVSAYYYILELNEEGFGTISGSITIVK